MSPIEVGLIGFACLIAVIFLQVPIAIAMAVTGAAGYLILTGNLSGMISLFGTETVNVLMNKDFAVIMFFLLMGGFAGAANLSADIYRFANAWMGHMRGGLAMATIIGCGGFGAICGSSIATTATMARIAMPEMERRGYSLALCTGSLAAGGTLGSLVPPSVIMVIYAVQVEQFIIDLFIGAILPSILSVLLFIAAIRIQLYFQPQMAPLSPRMNFGERIAITRKTWGAIFVIVVVMGGIYTGVFTVNEGAAIGLVLALAFAVGRRLLTGETFWKTLREQAGSIALLYLILIGANIFGYFITLSHMPEAMVEWVKALGIPPIAVIFVLIVMYIVLGCVFDALSGMVLTLPFVAPLVAGLGYDLVWWGIVNVMLIEIGMITPPVGINVFVMHGLRKDIPLATIFRGITPFLLANLVALAIVVAFPEMVTWLPKALK
ncbi:TRAP transporter large permease [Pseudorhodoplanes sinuspersici]|uniref:TRAP transporter large permease protein n=1 Tax=Pseudorhodoplanes sinuspersici TaxID=1235591 RepID=A0A1W6ZKA2_9HYPH|nr:TRAP transporter large permease [Pseudorhodoplanes sinuspersici]ARP97843.1 C4-dicarboxylate ABC transporter permease [Pseudorhodoplanes sinuspersici]RKE68425.1 tripartite ATP-independent transporter DctM subunit [Pseudorhodoplanes sinuspersici]